MICQNRKLIEEICKSESTSILRSHFSTRGVFFVELICFVFVKFNGKTKLRKIQFFGYFSHKEYFSIESFKMFSSSKAPKLIYRHFWTCHWQEDNLKWERSVCVRRKFLLTKNKIFYVMLRNVAKWLISAKYKLNNNKFRICVKKLIVFKFNYGLSFDLQAHS